MTPLDQLHADPGGADEPQEGGPRMSFLQHLSELRRRLFRAFIGTLIGLAIAFSYDREILDFLIGPIQSKMGTLSVIAPAEAFLNRFKAAFIGGIVLAGPYIIFELWSFISPGLHRRERRWVWPVMLVGTVLFLGGAAFSYRVVVPQAASFLAQQGEGFDQHITVDAAFGFGSKLLLGLGLMFEMPLVVFALTRLGLISASFLIRKMGVAIFLIFLISAILTPTPDIFTMTIFALPLLGLYMLSIGVAWLFKPAGRR